MSTLELKVYDILKSKFSEKEASDVIEYVQTKVKETLEEKMVHSQILPSKDLEILRKEMATKEDIASLKSEILKWMVGMFIPLYLTIIGLIITLLLKH